MKISHLLSVLCLIVGAQAHAQLDSSEGSTAVTVDSTAAIPQALQANPDDENGFHGGGGGPRPTFGGGGPHPMPNRPGWGGPGFGHGGGPVYGGPGRGPGMPGWGGRPGGYPGWHGPGMPGWYGGPRPGWYNGWTWNYGIHPFWWNPGFSFPVFVWESDIPAGWWQCTAFDQYATPYSAAALTSNEAAYDAMYDCGGENYAQSCYIPEGYCQFR